MMKKQINEVARLKKLAGILNESFLNEEKDLNSYSKILVDKLQKNGFDTRFTKNSNEFDKLSKIAKEKKDAKLAVVLYDDMNIPGDGYMMIGVNNNTSDEIGKILDSLESELPTGGRHFTNNMWSWQITGPGLAKKK